jgi:hypothetical protein
MKTSISQIQTTIDSIISRLDQTEERVSEMEADKQPWRENC